MKIVTCILYLIIGLTLFLPDDVHAFNLDDLYEIDTTAIADGGNDSSMSADGNEMSIDDVLDLSALDEEASLFAEGWVVTGTKQKRKSIDSPFSVFTLDRAQIEDLCAKGIVDLLRAVPGFDVFRVRDGVINASEPGYSTEYGSQYLVLVDGVAFQNKRGRSTDWATLPVQIDEIERIEYLPGAQSTLYGSYAAIGVLNIITRKVSPETWDEEHASSLRLRTGSDGLAIYDLTHNTTDDKLTTSFYGSFRDIDNSDEPVNNAGNYLDQGASKMNRAGFTTKHALSDTQNLRLDFNYLRGDRSPYLPAYTDSRVEKLQEISAVATYSQDYAENDNFTFVIKNINKKDTNPQATTNVFSDFQIEARRQMVDSGGRIISFGGYYERINSNGDSYQPGDNKLMETSINALVEQPLKNDQSIFLGVNGYDSSYTGFDMSYKFSYKKNTTKREAFRAGYGTSVKGPDIYFSYLRDITVTPPFGPPIVVFQGNPDLENEEFAFAEVSYERRTASSLVHSRFYTGKVKNRILSVSGTPPFPGPATPGTFANEDGKNKQTGLTTTWDKRFKENFRTTLTWRYLRAKNDDGTASWYSPKNVINFMANYDATDRLSLTLFSKTSTSYNTEDGTLSVGTDPVGGYTTLDFAARVKTRPDDSQELWFRVDNLTDRELVETYGVPTGSIAPGWNIGRTVSVGYGFKF